MNTRVPAGVAGAVALSLALGFGAGTAAAAGTAGALDTGFGHNGIEGYSGGEYQVCCKFPVSGAPT